MTLPPHCYNFIAISGVCGSDNAAETRIQGVNHPWARLGSNKQADMTNVVPNTAVGFKPLSLSARGHRA